MLFCFNWMMTNQLCLYDSSSRAVNLMTYNFFLKPNCYGKLHYLLQNIYLVHNNFTDSNTLEITANTEFGQSSLRCVC